MKGVSDYAIVYDISSNSERRKVRKLLRGFGFPVQKSVFECRMNKRIKRELIRRLQQLNLGTGFVKIYRLEYSSRGEVIGVNRRKDIDAGPAFII